MKSSYLFASIFIVSACATPPKISPQPARAPATAGTFAGIADGLAAGLYKGPIALPTNDANRAAAKLYLPLQYDQKVSWPLVILLHGFTGTAESEDSYLTMRFRVSTRGFILLTPEGTPIPKSVRGPNGEDLSGNFWNATDACCDFGATGVDDVAYLAKLIDSVATQYKVDKARIYVFGHSNGGFMANRLACEIGDRLAGVASLAGGTFKDVSACRNPTPVSYLQIHAVDDPTIAYGDPTVAYGEVPKYAGGTATVEQWVKKNGCTGGAKSEGRKDYVFLVPFKDTTLKSWPNCQKGTRTSFWTIQKHTREHHNSHVPIFNVNFTGDVLDFLLAQKKVD